LKRYIYTNLELTYSTRTLRRYRTPIVKEKISERARLKETLVNECNQAYLSFLAEISQNHYGLLRDIVHKLAVVDCIMSLALVSMQAGYVKPEFTDDDCFEIVNGRHPTLEQLRSDPFVPNSSTMGAGVPKSAIITGPNMGGKSSCVRQIALIAIMAQMGAYVPADSLKLSMLDSVLTRMGGEYNHCSIAGLIIDVLVSFR
jgi:DNA mismatch repair protein MSH3